MPVEDVCFFDRLDGSAFRRKGVSEPATQRRLPDSRRSAGDGDDHFGREVHVAILVANDRENSQSFYALIMVEIRRASPEEVAQAVRDAVGEDVNEPPTPLGRGYGNEGWLVNTDQGRRVVKIAVRWPGGERQRNAAIAAGRANEAGVRTPQALAVVDDGFDGRGFGVWEWIEGRDAVDALESFDDRIRRDWFVEVGRVLRELHWVRVPFYAPDVITAEGDDRFEDAMRTRIDKVLGRYEAAGLDPGETVRRAVEKLDGLVDMCASAARPALVHNDVYLDNLLVAPDGRPVVIDFEHARLFDPLQDLVKPEMFIEPRWPGSTAAIRLGYEEQGPVPLFEERLHLGIGLELVWALPFFHQWGDHSVVDAYRKRLTSWLAH